MSDNKISCDVIRDLLPLFVDGVCSDESRILVSEHIDACGECSQEYKKLMQKPIRLSADNDGENKSLEKVGKKLRKDRKKSLVKGIAIALALIFIIAALITPDVMIALAKRQYVPNPEIVMNVYNHKDGEIDVGRIKINLPEKYDALPNGLHTEHTETSTYILLSDPNQLSTSTNQRINVHDLNAVNGEAPKLDFKDELYGNHPKIVRAMDKIGARQLGFGENDFYEFINYLYSAGEPDYGFFSSFKKKAAVFAYYDCYYSLLPSGVSTYHFQTDSYKCYGYALAPVFYNEDALPMMFAFELYDKGIAIEIIGFTKPEAEYIMSSLVIK